MATRPNKTRTLIMTHAGKLRREGDAVNGILKQWRIVITRATPGKQRMQN